MNNGIIQETIEDENKQLQNNEKNTLKSLKEKQNNLLSSLKKQRKKSISAVFVILVCTILTISSAYIKIEFESKMNIFQSIVYYLVGSIPVMIILYKLDCLNENKKMKTDLKFDLSNIEDDIFLEEIKKLTYEEKALKQLSKKQIDIERYHDLNISHTKIIFIIGVIIIFIGISIIAFTIASIFFTPNSAQLIVIISGFAGGLLVDGIGGIFILMYSKTIESTQEYQTTMTETTNTYLGNVLVSQINNNELREQTLSIMATELVQKVKSKEK